MNFMEKFNELANRTLVPIANKLGNQRHLAAIRDGMVVAIPLSILGGVCLIISTPPFKPETLPNWGFITDNHIHHKIHEYFFLGIKPKIITINRYYQYVFL